MYNLHKFPHIFYNSQLFYMVPSDFMYFVISVILGRFQDPSDLRTSNIRQQLLSYIAVPEQRGQSLVVHGDSKSF